jgi:hypothetical protein
MFYLLDVASGTSTHSKGELERLVQIHGGECVQNALESTDYVLVGDESMYFRLSKYLIEYV